MAIEQAANENETIVAAKVSYRRAFLLGLILMPINVYWVIAAELRFDLVMSLNPLFITPVFYLFVLWFVNLLIEKLFPKYILKPHELVVIYVMLVMSCTIASVDYLINLISLMPWPQHLAETYPAFIKPALPYLPKWLFVWDRQVVKDLFSGDATVFSYRVLRAWLPPLGFWLIFITASCWIMLCMTVMIRKAWMENVKLSYPIVRLPFAMTERNTPASLMRSHVMWFGFGIAAFLGILKQLNHWYPSIVSIQTGSQWIPINTAPWSAMGAIPVSFYPFDIGLAYLVPLDVSFSCWFFYLLYRFESVLLSVVGLGSVNHGQLGIEQGLGAWFSFALVLIWGIRKHLRHVIQIALHPDGSDSGEPMSYRLAFFGLIAGGIVFVGFWWAAGMNPLWSFLMMVTYLLVSIAITRVRAEAGAQHVVWAMNPLRIIQLFDSRLFSQETIAASAMSHWYVRFERSHMMPSQMEAFKLAGEHGMNMRKLVAPVLIALVLATIVGMGSSLHVLLKHGVVNAPGYYTGAANEGINWYARTVTGGYEGQGHIGVVAGAAVFVFFLAWLREKAAWMPFNPLGYCIGFGMNYHWVPFLIAWLIKLFVLRFGGLKLFRQTLPFFLGLVLGDYITGAVWSLVGLLTNLPPIRIFL